MDIQNELRVWAKHVVKKYDPVAKTENSSYYTQSNLKIIKRSPQVLILGINPGSSSNYKAIDPETFLGGNPSFSTNVTWPLCKVLSKIFR